MYLAWTYILAQVMCLTCYFNMKLTLITAQFQRFPLTHFTYVYVTMTFQTAGGLGFIIFHAQCILVKHFSLLCPQSQLDKDMEQFLAQ